MTTEFRLPDLGEGLVDAELVAWQVAVGDTVTLNQTIAEVETAKAVVELPSPYVGTVAALHAEPGDVIEVGGQLISFELESGEDAPEAGEGGVEGEERAAEPSPASQPPADDRKPGTTGRGPEAGGEDEAPETSETRQATLVGYGAAVSTGRRPARRARRRSVAADADAAVIEAAPHDAVDASPGRMTTVEERPRSTPPVRKHAKDLGVDLAEVPATGENGLITRDDVDRFAEAAGTDVTPVHGDDQAAAPSRSEEFGSDRIVRTPIRGVRRRTADAMVRSAFTAPHAATFLTVDVTPTLDFLARLRAERGEDAARIGILAIAAKAVCLALRRNPSLNSSWDDDAGEIVEYRYVNLGIAAATGRGLVVPSVKEAHELDLAQLAEQIGLLARAARDGRVSPADLAGSTFTITNVGVFGVDTGTPILNPGEAGILALGAVRRQPWEHEGAIALRDVTTLSLSFDHRLVDGEQAARFLTDVGAILREPARAMLMM